MNCKQIRDFRDSCVIIPAREHDMHSDSKSGTSPIVIAEDDKSIAEVMTIILQGEGYTVELVEDYDKILSFLKLSGCGLLFLDLSLSGQNGADICKKVKAHNATKNIPVVILSANADVEIIASSAGANDVLKKPFDIEDLIGIAKKYIS